MPLVFLNVVVELMENSTIRRLDVKSYSIRFHGYSNPGLISDGIEALVTIIRLKGNTLCIVKST